MPLRRQFTRDILLYCLVAFGVDSAANVAANFVQARLIAANTGDLQRRLLRKLLRMDAGFRHEVPPGVAAAAFSADVKAVSGVWTGLFWNFIVPALTFVVAFVNIATYNMVGRSRRRRVVLQPSCGWG